MCAFEPKNEFNKLYPIPYKCESWPALGRTRGKYHIQGRVASSMYWCHNKSRYRNIQIAIAILLQNTSCEPHDIGCGTCGRKP